jgi:hypothetical protein
MNSSSFPARQEIFFFLKGSRPEIGSIRLPFNQTHAPQLNASAVALPVYRFTCLALYLLTAYVFLVPMLIKMGTNHYSVVQKGTPVVRDRWHQIQITFKFRVLAPKLCVWLATNFEISGKNRVYVTSFQALKSEGLEMS